jgi:3-mercaptopyruvate sulfurtransferase SseA
MNTRIKLSVLLVAIGILLAFIPFNTAKSFYLKPSELLSKANSEEIYFSTDQVARFVNNEDSTIQLIDLRNEEEYKTCNISGSINIPFADLLNPDWEGY